MPPKTVKNPAFQLSVEQLALQAARRALKEQRAAKSTEPDAAQAGQVQVGRILRREWLESAIGQPETGERLIVMTWNVSNVV